MKFTKFFAIAFAAFALVACEEKTPADKPGDGPQTSGSLVLKADKTAIAVGETVTFTVEQMDATGAAFDVTADCTIYDNDFNSVGSSFTAESTGIFKFFATKGSENSNYVTVNVMAVVPELPADPQPENFAFNHRALLIDHTGVNCPNCPYMTDNLLALADTEYHKHYNEVTCHAGGYAAGDPANSEAAEVVCMFQSISAWPTVLLNFYITELPNYANPAPFVREASQWLDAYIQEDGADVGITMATSGDTENVFCSAQLKAAKTNEYKVVAWLLENDIYSPNQAGATKEHHKIYNYALRNISGDYDRNNITGDSIGTLEEGQTYDCSFTLPIASNKWNHENLGVIIIVTAKDSKNRWEVVNTAYCAVNENKAYEYVE